MMLVGKPAKHCTLLFWTVLPTVIPGGRCRPECIQYLLAFHWNAVLPCHHRCTLFMAENFSPEKIIRGRMTMPFKGLESDASLQ
jgi:hypothetical protein